MEEAGDKAEPTPAEQWGAESDKRALDELFTSVGRYSSSPEFKELVKFTERFRHYSPFNALLIHMQMPGATYVLRASEWRNRYGRTIKPGARPLVALQPMGPVMFLYDVSDTEGEDLPRGVTAPFEPKGNLVGKELERTLDNCARDGIRMHRVEQGSQSAGSIQSASAKSIATVIFRKKSIPIAYELILNANTSPEAQYATLAHELGHLYCGHLGTPNPKWWPDRRRLPVPEQEFEAESVCYLVCLRRGIENPSAKYLHGYLENQSTLPAISLERVLVAAGLIEQMGRRRLPLRKAKEG